MKRVLILLALLFCCSLSMAVEFTSPNAKMLRFPDVSEDTIVFLYAGDLWRVDKDGGLASRLTSSTAMEQFPKFSPDGKMIAFNGNYDGNTDVYIIGSEGGSPVRLTHHSSPDMVVDWYPDGKNILYRSTMESPRTRFNQFYKQSIEGGLAEKLKLPYGELASFNEDGTKMVFQIISCEFRTWKRYRGGMASDLWLYDFEKEISEKITNFDGTDAVAMWHGDTIYFLSDRDEQKRLNIWALDIESKEVRQVTEFKDFDVKWPSMGPSDIVFENGGKLYLLDLETEEAKALDIRVPADLPKVRKSLKDASKNILHFNLSPSGKRALFEARGEIFTVPAKYGSVRDLTNTSGAAERFPVWSPDSKSIAYFSDVTGEYELYVLAADGKSEAKQITTGGDAFRYNPVWSPDSKKIAFVDKSGRIYIVVVADKSMTLVDKVDLLFYDESSTKPSYSWSSDSKWLAYSKFQDTKQNAIMIYDSVSKEIHKVTSGFYDDSYPVFDTEGKYLFFYSNRTFNAVYSDMDATWVYPNSTGIYAASLRKDVESLLKPRSDEESLKKDKEADKKKADDKKNGDDDENCDDEDDDKDEVCDSKEADKVKEVNSVEIDFDGFEQRVVELPIEAGNFVMLAAIKDKIVYQKNPAAGAVASENVKGCLRYYDLKEREEKTVIDGINDYSLSADGKKVIYQSDSTYGIVDLAEGKKVGDERIATDKMKVWIEPREEWRQIFVEAWRIQRDFFYDPGMHGVDWKATRDWYGQLLDYVVDREDLNYVMGEMFGELNASHAYVGGGDIDWGQTISVGLLGCDYVFDKEKKAYKISRICRPGVWEAGVRSPLDQPGVDVKEGDYLLKVNGHDVDITKDPWAAFQGLADEVVTLTIGKAENISDTNEIIVKPMSSEQELRYLAWVEENRKKVELATDGKVGYVYVPSTGYDGQSELVRQFVPQRTKEGMIIDERFNSGGQIPDRFIELMNRPLYNFWTRRDCSTWQTPYVSHIGPKVMLMNGWSGSGGDAFPYYFKKAGLGPLIGKRTWGGLIGYSDNPKPIDGGFIAAPTFAIWSTDGKWEIEGYGVDPDYDLDNEPHMLAKGCDQQLDKAIEVILKKLKENPVKIPSQPAFPDRSK